MQDFSVDYNIKIEMEMENKNTEQNETNILRQDPVNVNKQCRLGLRIRDVAKLSENKREDQSIPSESDISKSSFECEHCNKTYSSKGNLKTHVLSAHSIHEGITYLCSHCEYKATTKGHLKIHIQS